MSREGLDRFRFVLVEPRYAGNVGSAARVLKNLGFTRFELVAPSCSVADDDAVRLAVDAGDLLAAARLHATLEEALLGATAAVGTSRRMGKHRQPHFRIDELAPRLARLPSGSTIAVLFGREADGLTDAELDRCTHLAYVPTSDAYPAMNLAQAVAIVAYEIGRAVEAIDPSPPPRPLGVDDDDPAAGQGLAEHAAREALYAHLEEALLAIGFLKDGQIEGMMRRLRRILGRAELTPGDVDVLRGIARQILWLARTR